MALTARLDRWVTTHPRTMDQMVAGVVWLGTVPFSAVLAGPAGFVIATATVVPLAVRRRRPAALLAWTAGMFGLQLVLVPIPLPANLAQALVVYTVAAHVPSLPARLLALGTGCAGCLAGGFRWSTPPRYVESAVGTGLFLAVLTGLIWVIGNLVRGREVNVRALREADARLAEGRRQQERFAAHQRRVAAAREIHDIVAHSLTVVVVQADGAGYAAEHAARWSRAEAQASLATIGQTARAALAEVREVIDVLRDPDAVDERPGSPVGAVQLGKLVDTVRAAGLPVEVDAGPDVFPEVSSAVGLIVLRVVREALTNSLKHAGPRATVRVTVDRTPDALRVRVTDDGLGALAAPDPAAAPGHGLTGMRERLRALGGALVAGPLAGGGFGVEATVPRTARPRPAAPDSASGEDR
jgi:signal transduction histidine kinase